MRLLPLLIVATLPACHKAHPAVGPSVDLRVDVPDATSADGANLAREEGATTALEQACSRVPHLAHLHGVSQEGTARVTVELEPGATVDEAFPAIQECIHGARATLPQDAGPVTLAKGSRRIARRMVWSSQVVPMSQTDGLRQPAWIVPLAQTTGVGSIGTCGGAVEEIVVDLDANRLASTSLTVAEVVAALSKTHLESGDASGLRPLVLAMANGAPVRLSDVGTVRDDGRARTCRAYDERGAVAEDIVRVMDGADADAVGKAADAQLTNAVRALPPGIDVHAVTVGREITVDLEPAIAPAAYAQVHQALTAVPAVGRFVLEIGSVGDAEGTPPTAHLLLESSDESVATAVRGALARMPFVRAAGEPNATLELIGVDRAALKTAEEELLRKVAGHAEVVARLGTTERIVQVARVDEDLARKLGLPIADLRLALAVRRGKAVADVGKDGRSVPLVVRLDGPLDRIFVRGPSGLVPLSAVVAWTSRSTPAVLLQEDHFPMVGARVHASDVPGLQRLYPPPAGIQLRVVPD